ncbi:Gfo/Idh/MocA family protein [Jiangella asiatica]|uniref:Gfo/Idh/MocA family oxidoreductase n=1 Tax=Jiangella asiatica TaxID=2530372 RepID=A0A4R5D8J9_9ACTN|nr:Gfo/Idh/MocA family oxidoreductase [Jiangella asiatica]TDE09889.1 Gfo/Idh/MocA family oxidoreductase [Jiangella asiatica]
MTFVQEPSQPLRVAVVGTGQIARFAHLPAVRSVGAQLELVAAVDVDESVAKEFATSFGAGAAFTDVATMLDAVRPDLVLVCTPPAWHAEVVVATVRAGAWAFCEKPPTASLAELDRIAAAEAAGGGRAEFVFQWRTGSAAEHVRRLIADGTLGRALVAMVSTTWYRDAAYYEAPWRGRWETEIGGATAGQGIHAIDLLLSLLGPWRTVTAVADTLERAIEVEDTSMAIVRFESGALASLVTSVLCPREDSAVRIDLQDATVELRQHSGDGSGWTVVPRPGLGDDRLAAAGPVPHDVPASHGSQLRRLVDDLRAGRAPATGVGQVRPTVELLAALYKSAASGRPVRAGEIGPDDPYYASMHGGRGTVSTG